MSNVDLFVYGVLLKDGHFTCIFAVVQYPMFVSSHPEWCVHYDGSDKTEKGLQMLSLYRFLVRVGTRALIKHGEIGDDSKAAPEKLNHQPFAKKWPKCPKCPNFGYL